MTLDEFEDLLDRNGHDIGTWPQGPAAAAASLLAESPDARRLLAEAATLDELFETAPPLRAPAGLAGRIVARAMSETDTPSAAHAATAGRATPTPTPVHIPARPDRRPLQTAVSWHHELASLIFGTGNPIWPAAALAICFATGLGAGYIFSEQSIDSSSYDVMASLFTYFYQT